MIGNQMTEQSEDVQLKIIAEKALQSLVNGDNIITDFPYAVAVTKGSLQSDYLDRLENCLYEDEIEPYDLISGIVHENNEPERMQRLLDRDELPTQRELWDWFYERENDGHTNTTYYAFVPLKHATYPDAHAIIEQGGIAFEPEYSVIHVCISKAELKQFFDTNYDIDVCPADYETWVD